MVIVLILAMVYDICADFNYACYMIFELNIAMVYDICADFNYGL